MYIPLSPPYMDISIALRCVSMKKVMSELNLRELFTSGHTTSAGTPAQVPD